MDISLDFCPFATEYGKVAKEGWESIPADKQEIYGDVFWIMRECKALLSCSINDCHSQDIKEEDKPGWLIKERWAHITQIRPRLNYFRKKYQMDLSTAFSVIDHIAQGLAEKGLLSSYVPTEKIRKAIKTYAANYEGFLKEERRKAKEEAAEKAARKGL